MVFDGTTYAECFATKGLWSFVGSVGSKYYTIIGVLYIITGKKIGKLPPNALQHPTFCFCTDYSFTAIFNIYVV